MNRNRSLYILAIFTLFISCTKPDETSYKDLYNWEKTQVIKSFGTFYVDFTCKEMIIFKGGKEILIDSILYDTIQTNVHVDGLYKMTFEKTGKEYFFRFGQQQLLENDRVQLSNLVWSRNIAADTGSVTLELVKTPFNQHGNVEIATIGDSYFWWGSGEKFRLYLNRLAPRLHFVGYRTDTYGYPHEAEGGSSTVDILNRMHRIVKADNYMLLIGTNDRKHDLSSIQSFNNIKLIIKKLLIKNPKARVYVLTIPPRVSECKKDRNVQMNNEINQLIRQSLPTTYPTNVKVIDTFTNFNNIPNWPQYTIDGLHPTREGYMKLCAFISTQLN